MPRHHGIFILTTLVALAAGCAARNRAAGDVVIDPAAAMNTVVLHVRNDADMAVSLHASGVGIHAAFLGSVGAHDSTDILLDPSMFPTSNLYLTTVAGAGSRRAVVGPLIATKGDRILLDVEPVLTMSRARVVH